MHGFTTLWVKPSDVPAGQSEWHYMCRGQVALDIPPRSGDDTPVPPLLTLPQCTHCDSEDPGIRTLHDVAPFCNSGLAGLHHNLTMI